MYEAAAGRTSPSSTARGAHPITSIHTSKPRHLDAPSTCLSLFEGGAFFNGGLQIKMTFFVIRVCAHRRGSRALMEGTKMFPVAKARPEDSS
eukprot:1158858-Pelagomonas_calceolata.AAC.5